MNATRIVALAAGVLCSSVAAAGTVKVSWTPPTTCSDGSPITECPATGYEISEATSDQGPLAVKETVAGTLTTASYVVGVGQTRCYSLKTVSNALKSDPSNRVCITVPFVPPKAPIVTVTITVTIPPP